MGGLAQNVTCFMHLPLTENNRVKLGQCSLNLSDLDKSFHVGNGDDYDDDKDDV